MAFIDFTSMIPGTAAIAMAAQRPSALVEERADLTPLQWQVVTLARGDRLSSLREPGRIARLTGLLFGRRHNPRLADPALEVLRRLSVFAWHHGFAVPVSATRAALDAGYTAAQVEAVLASIGAARLRVIPASRASRRTGAHPIG